MVTLTWHACKYKVHISYGLINLSGVPALASEVASQDVLRLALIYPTGLTDYSSSPAQNGSVCVCSNWCSLG